MNLVELFQEVIYQTELGQLLDLTSQPMDGPTDLDRFTHERYVLLGMESMGFISTGVI